MYTLLLYLVYVQQAKCFEIRAHSCSACSGWDDLAACLQALNEARAKTLFSSPSEVSVWELIDLSALPSDQAEAYPAAALSHLGFQDRLWENTPTSTTDFWDKYSQVCKTCLL